MSNTKQMQAKQRFTRKSLNLMIICVAFMILLFSQTPRLLQGPAKTTPEQTSQTVLTSEVSPVSAILEEDKPEISLSAIREQIQALPQPSVTVDIQHWTHDSGAKVLFVASPEIPMLDIQMVFDAGSARDNNLPGLARMTNNLIGEGTKKYSVTEIARQFEDLGSHFSTSSQRDMAIISLRSLSSDTHLTASLNLLTHVVSQPNFPDDSLNRVRNIMKLSIEKAKASPRKLISQATWANLYPNHPYGHYPGGTQGSLDKISQKELIEFHQTYYVQSNLNLAIVGAVSWEKAKQIAEQILNTLPLGKTPAPLPKANILSEPKQVHIPFPSQQTHIRVATLSTTKGSEEHIPLTLANAVLGGGGFSSKLNQVIRQDNGLAYSIYSYVSAMQSEGVFLINMQTKNESAPKALDLVNQTFNQFIENGIAEDDLKKAKNHIIAGYPLGLASNSSILSQLGHIAYYGLPLDYLDQYTKTITQLSPKQSAEVFKQTIGQQPLLTITLGPKPINEIATPNSQAEEPSS